MKENVDGSWKKKTDTLMSWWEVQQDCGPFGILEHTREILKYLFGQLAACRGKKRTQNSLGLNKIASYLQSFPHKNLQCNQLLWDKGEITTPPSMDAF